MISPTFNGIRRFCKADGAAGRRWQRKTTMLYEGCKRRGKNGVRTALQSLIEKDTPQEEGHGPVAPGSDKKGMIMVVFVETMEQCDDDDDDDDGDEDDDTEGDDDNVDLEAKVKLPGSVSGSNCKVLAGQPHVDGFLVGGASLKSPEKIIWKSILVVVTSVQYHH
ncbi:triosephosphate isomerase, cytosolic [Tanacetum coccineum]|uniref:Triosephosphate isomerase, cytosolic n=1 Tax=Tanacetum coccineum TaxID=301880 RepID=A0ABQ5GGN2_9ASTR